MAAAAAAVVAEPWLHGPLFSPARQRGLSSPSERKFTFVRTVKLHSGTPPVPSLELLCPCAAGNLDPVASEDGAASGLVSEPSTASFASKEGGKDRRRAVRVAWEKLVRWSRSWRSRAKSDVLERTKKVIF